ncbi:hypothetical protein BJV82DRAFT_631365 [Fennellomyces sp. T-0311]|nr:hypothetical protein BJV82DRAFT_631365 [Fennellomyces sp. T-0311]
MEIDLQAIVENLRKRGYQPDVYITLSEHVFSALNYRMLRGLLDNGTTVYTAISQFDQIQAYLEGRVDRVWHYNTYSNGFFALLDILLAKTSSHRPWTGTLLTVPRIYEICNPGQYYVELSDSPYCVAKESGITSPSIRCAPCPMDTFSSDPNQHECTPCPYGEYSEEGSASCVHCNDGHEDSTHAHTQCIIYAQDQAQKRRRIFIGIFVPVGVIVLGALLGFCFWRFRKYRKIRLLESPSQTAWLLSYDELMRPSMQHMSSLPSPNSMTSVTKENNEALSPSVLPLLGAEDNSSSTPTSPHILDKSRTPELVASGAAALAAPLAPKTQRSMSEGNEDEGEHQHGNATEPGTRDYFTLATVHEAPTLLYYPDRHTKRLIRAIGFHRNLPVFVKQIGFRRVHLNQTAYHEIALMKMARHSKLVEFIGLCIEPQGTFLVEEYCSKGTLYDVLKNPDLDLTWIFRFSLINDLIEGLEFLHRSKFLFHGCLTSQACVVTGRWELKITDFGLYKVRESQYDPVTIASLSKRYPKETCHDSSVSGPRSLSPTHNHGYYDSPMHVVPHTENLLWLAPESVVDTNLDIWITYPSKKADIYSLGMILNEIVTRAKPYQKELIEFEENYEAVFDRIKHHDLLPAMLTPDQDVYVGQVNEIIISCLRREVMSRPSIGHVKSRIKIIDPHITGSDNVVDNLALLLEKYANNMENLVRKRTANLQQRTIELEEERARTQNLLKDLKAAKEVAEAAAASKQNFLANMSHEIRTPMNAVIGMSRILMESNLPAELHDCAETIESSGNHLMAIIDDILDYSKIDSGKLGLEHRRMDLIFVFESALKLVAPNYMDKGIILWYIIDADVSTGVYGDVVRLRQILLNLLSNALKFTSEGYVSVHVSRQGSSPSTPTSLEPDDSDENSGLLSESRLAQGPRTESLLVSIRDTGIGIRKDKADKLFQTFSQVDASTTRNFGGTGLGLAISRRLTRMMGGDMWFDSESGQGSTFYFTVKLQKQADSPTYASFNCFSELTRLCHSVIIVADNHYGRKAWNQLFGSIPMPQAKVMCFNDAEKELKQKTKEKLSLLVIDEEFEVIKTFGPTPTTSQTVLTSLQECMPFLRSIPTICIKDMRNQRRERISDASDQLTLPQMAKQIPLEQDSPTPGEERRNPFDSLDDGRTLYLVKPLKNSKLLAAFLKLLRPPNDDSKQTKSNAASPTASPAASLDRSTSIRYKRRERSNTIGSSLSSTSTTSSGRPLNEIAGSVRSLLVDDNPVNQKVVMRMLSRLGVRPEVAQNGKEACDAVRKSQKTDDPIDLVFMDIWMPEMNGFEASEYIRSNLSESSVHPYIIAMTACVMPGDREKCLASGMNGYVSKPVRKDELEASLHTYTQVIVSGVSDESQSERSATESAPPEAESELPSVKVTSNDNSSQ